MQIQEFVSQYLKSREMTMADLTAMLGYRSKTSVIRIIKGNVSQRILDSFSAKMREVGNLTCCEKKALDNALERRQWQDDYYPSLEMQSLLEGNMPRDEKITLTCVTGSNDVYTFEQRYGHIINPHIVLVNCQYVPLFVKLQRMIQKNNALVSHFLMIDDDTSGTIRAVNAILPLIHEPNYSGYISTYADHGSFSHRLAANIMIISYIDETGVAREDAILFESADHGRLFECAEPGAFWRFVSIPIDSFKPIKCVYTDDDDSRNYINFSLRCANLEYKRALYAIKPDICFGCVPTEILYAAALEGPIAQAEGYQQMLEGLRRIFQERYFNFIDKRKPSHFVMKRTALWKFARTGRLSDHFWGLRAFTFPERAAILRAVLQQAEENPYYQIYLVKDEEKLLDFEMVCFEDEAMLILSNYTDYNLSEGHAEVLIRHPEFMRLYKEYYLKHLIHEEVISQTETLDFLRTLIKYCENENDSGA